MAAQRSPRKARDCREVKRVSSSARWAALAGLLLLDGFDDGSEAVLDPSRGSGTTSELMPFNSFMDFMFFVTSLISVDPDGLAARHD